jgi:threonine synthase
MATFRCEGCGASVDGPLALRCPNAESGDGADHLLTRRLPLAERFPDGEEAAFLAPEGRGVPAGAGANPFVRYGALLALGDDASRARTLDDAVARTWGRGFRVTPLVDAAPLARAVGVARLFVKDETQNVSGSHKARHLFGVMLAIESARTRGDLAIASCGNAALAAAVIARAAGRRLTVFVPRGADPVVLARLGALEARIETCAREPGVLGDPCYHRFRAAVARGALPFACQGPDCAVTIEGGRTLGYEIAEQLPALPDRLFVQVGGGALASSVLQALGDAARLGRIARVPRIHAVQTRGAFPLARAWRAVATRAVGPIGDDAALADACAHAPSGHLVGEALRHAATHRAEYMRPWESEPHSVAHGILDDETYDWLEIVRGMLWSGGYPVVVDEETLVEANRIGREATGIDVDPTGSAGLAGLLALRAAGAVGAGESAAVIFSGVKR